LEAGADVAAVEGFVGTDVGRTGVAVGAALSLEGVRVAEAGVLVRAEAWVGVRPGVGAVGAGVAVAAGAVGFGCAGGAGLFVSTTVRPLAGLPPVPTSTTLRDGR
jgi:hypothetical protein